MNNISHSQKSFDSNLSDSIVNTF